MPERLPSPRHGRDAPGTGVLLLLLALMLGVLGGAGYAIVRLLAAGEEAGVPDTATDAGKAGGGPATALARIPIAPVEYLPVKPEDARAINAAIPFAPGPNPTARPLLLSLAPADEARAVDCLAAAAWYEAGDDAVGERAVVQVVLNRLRHPAFPKTVCGVVFQGAERVTGCQFTFACDGALGRRPSDAAWLRAQRLASAGLHGGVFSSVGYATHYHTDWVVPNWNSSVDKIAMVGTHLFFRWRGAAGRPGAFVGRHAGFEPVIAKLTAVSAAHRAVEPPPIAAAPTDAPVAALPTPTASSGGGVKPLVIDIEPGAFSGAPALAALRLCRSAGKGPCTVVGFQGQRGRVSSDALGRLSWPDRPPDFYYFSDPARGRETALWNCAKLPRPDARQCLPAGFTGVAPVP